MASPRHARNLPRAKRAPGRLSTSRKLGILITALSAVALVVTQVGSTSVFASQRQPPSATSPAYHPLRTPLPRHHRYHPWPSHSATTTTKPTPSPKPTTSVGPVDDGDAATHHVIGTAAAHQRRSHPRRRRPVASRGRQHRRASRNGVEGRERRPDLQHGRTGHQRSGHSWLRPDHRKECDAQEFDHSGRLAQVQCRSRRGHQHRQRHDRGFGDQPDQSERLPGRCLGNECHARCG